MGIWLNFGSFPFNPTQSLALYGKKRKIKMELDLHLIIFGDLLLNFFLS
jgi:hypothetical protein